ncbi:hypothetical protein GKN89_03915 [Serratia sp. YC16]|uniref:hypothetical protein n=1 Tax=Serratia sp. YC16 TaxID=2675312 RepID=UPI0012B94D74|nr:hypothetical protein [Serratia sp. YC16]MTD05878.1 hypothetical protein [Serratia sp. YC16]
MANYPSENGCSLLHERAIEQTLADMNSVLLESNLFMTRLTVQDRRWQKGRKNGHTLNWRSLFKYHVQMPMSFAFVYRQMASPLSRAGFCLCRYLQAENVIELVALENFSLRETQHPLKGNMLRNCLQALYLYGLNLQEQGLTPASPPDILISHAINHRVLALYTRQAAFEVIPGTMTCKTRFSALKNYIQSLEKYGTRCDKVRINNEQQGSQNGK